MIRTPPPSHTLTRLSAMALLPVVAMVALLLVPFATTTWARQQEPDRVITIGESNSPEQRQQLLDIFGADDNDRVMTITVEQTADAMRGIFDLTGIDSAYSSTALTCRDLGKGLDVTTRNIQQITPGLYAMALVTAGIGDAELIVAAPDGLAAVRGQTALAGVFETWDIAPCESGNTSKARQRLALEQLTLTSEIGDVVFGGVPAATELVLETQRQIVINNITSGTKIDDIIAEQEAALGFSIPSDLRQKLVDLMTRLATADIDWSTFASGWTIETNADNTQITMRGEGIAILRAQQTATAEAAAQLTATAEAETALTATADAASAMTATAVAGAAQTATASALSTEQAHQTAAAQATANAQSTVDAAAAMTATAAALPTATLIPPEAVTGEVVSNQAGQLTVRPPGTAAARTFPVDSGVSVTRAGTPVAIDVVAAGDQVQLLVDRGSGAVTTLSAEPAPETGSSLSGLGLFVLALGILGLLWWLLLAKRNREEPFVIKRVAT